MMISYANGTDYNLNLTDYLSKNNDQVDNIIINLKENVTIENNIFGLVYSGIKIKYINNCNKYYFISTTTNNPININYILEENENLLLRFSSNNENIISKCQLGYSYIITEPNFDEYNIYTISRVVYDSNNDKEKTVFDNLKIEYEGRTIYYDIFEKICDDVNCELCHENDLSECLKCKNNYIIQKDEYGKNKFCILDESNENINDNVNERMNSEQLKEFLDKIKENVLSAEFSGENQIIEKQNIICQISTLEDQKKNNIENVSSIDLGECEDILREKYNISEDESFLVIKIDIRNENLEIIYVQYEIYHPITKVKLNMDYCKDIKIVVQVPVNLEEYTISLYESLNEYGYNLFDSGDAFYNDICTIYTSQNGTDMLLEDRKKEIFSLSGNITMCQIGCDFVSYNKTTKKAKCNCEVQINSTETDETKLDYSNKEIASNFLKTLKNSNFLVLKCYKLCFKNFIQNKGQIVMSIIYVSFITLLIIYFIKDRKSITAYIYTIINSILKIEKEKNTIKIAEGEKKKVFKKKKKIKKKKKKIIKNNNSEILNNINNIINKDIITTKIINNFNEKNEQNIEINKKEFENKLLNENYSINKIKEENNSISKNKEDENNNIVNRDNNDNNENKNVEKNSNSENIYKNDNNNNENDNSYNQNNGIKNNLSGYGKCGPPLKRKYNYKILNTNSRNEVKNINSINSNQNVDLLSKSNQNLPNINFKLFPSINKKKDSIIENKNNENKISNNIEIYKKKTININKGINTIDNNIDNFQNLNDQELNTLEYENAIIYDKRTYFQYYWALLKKKQLILFTFLPANDYNLYSLKISLFLLSFSLYFTINGFFFDDKTMHKIHKENGKFNLLFQIPQILYSSVISIIINMLLKMLSLSENNILILKKEKNSNEAIKNGKKIEKCIIIKFIIFFILSNILLLFFWYFISCFCAVYKNTQSILIKDTLASFAISMIYPFIINLLPGLLRLPSLRKENKENKILYIISGFIALI